MLAKILTVIGSLGAALVALAAALSGTPDLAHLMTGLAAAYAALGPALSLFHAQAAVAKHVADEHGPPADVMTVNGSAQTVNVAAKLIAPLVLAACLLPLVGCGPSAAVRKTAHDLAHDLPLVFDHGDAQDRARCVSATAAIDAALND